MNNIIDKIRSFFKKAHNNNNNSSGTCNPWAGLLSYEDPAKATRQILFTGRTKETQEVYNLIDNNLLVTLYGKSGIGKTSLLNAGVFPLLRTSNYFPLYIRLGINDCGDSTSYAEAIINEIGTNINTCSTIDIVPENNDSESESFLWNYFARHRFHNRDEQVVFPVIVLDQFEEAIRASRHKSSILLKQIAYLIDKNNAISNCSIDGTEYIYDYNFRFVISLREDDLYQIEDLINQHYLYALKQCRYRLQNLSKASAKDVVVINGESCLKQNEKEDIANLLIDASTNKEDSLVSTNTLSLVCSRLFERMRLNKQSCITLQDATDYIKTNPLEDYYNQVIRNLTEKEKRFIEDNLVTSDGRRALIPANQISKGIKNYKTLLDGKTPILRTIKGHHDSSEKVELIHDGICPVVQKNRAIRLERKNRTIYGLLLFMAGVLSIWMLNTSIVDDLVAAFFTNANKGLKMVNLPSVVAFIEFLCILLFPAAIGGIVFNYKGKNWIATSLLCLFFIPILLYPHIYAETLSRTFNHVYSLLDQGIWNNIFPHISNRIWVYLIFGIILTITFISSILSKNNINSNTTFYKDVILSKYTLSYFFVISIYLYYKSIFNSNFTVDSFDSCWGFLIIPILLLYITGFKANSTRNKLLLTAYIVSLCSLLLISLLGFHASILIKLVILVLASWLLFMMLYQKKLIETLSKSVLNIVVLGIIILSNLGYNPYKITDSSAISKVYPWKIVIFNSEGKEGIIDAVHGDTLLIPEFMWNKDNPLSFARHIPDNDFLNSIKASDLNNPTYPFPFKLYKNSDNGWNFDIKCVPNLEYAVSELANSISETAIYDRTDVEGASLFFKLRNDIVSSCITGNQAYLINDIDHIKKYESLVKKDLDESLSVMSENDSIMSESQIVPFLESLSRCLYLNMLKESILRGHYSNYISWYQDYYIVTNLTRVTSKKRYINFAINANLTGNLNLSNKDNLFSNLIKATLHITLQELNEGLNKEKIYAWNNLLTIFFFLEFNAYSDSYANGINEYFESESKITDNIFKSCKAMIRLLENEYKTLQAQNKELTQILDNLLNSIEKGDKLNTIETANVLKSVLSIANETTMTKRNLSSTLNEYYENLNSTCKSLTDYELLQANKEFEIITTTTINSLSSIIKNIPFNPYNGLLFSICDNLYAIGKFRNYEMNKYALMMKDLGKYRSSPFYEFTCKVDSLMSKADVSRKKRSDVVAPLLDSIAASLNSRQTTHLEKIQR